MGKEQSKGKLPEFVGDNVIEVTNLYTLRLGKLSNGEPCSVFTGAKSPSLVTLANHLKTHRHPNIVKYLSSGEYGGQFYLMTEQVTPLAVVIEQQSTLELCVGLHSILSALSFLSTNAASSHNNVCCASVFVTNDGSWKLGGMEFMTKLSSTFSDTLRGFSGRYEPAMVPEEKSGRLVPSAIDPYAYGVFLTEVLTPNETADFPHLLDMLEFAKSRLVAADAKSRAKFSDVASHPFFCHDFIRINKFLLELPLKTSEEKLSFFRELQQQLRRLPEEMVASQLLTLLLARVVVLEQAAQELLIPMILRPISDIPQDPALFSEKTFKKYVVPKLLEMYCVRDTSVRLLLLSHLPVYLKAFTREQLSKQLLPELLVGVKDENDELVSATLHALAILVIELGGGAVVGGNRARLFSDGRPATKRPVRHETTPTTDHLPERPSPDGGEDSVAEDTETWSDWEQQSEKIEVEYSETIFEDLKASPKEPSIPKDTSKPVILAPPIAEIDALDIKTASSWRGSPGPDFFSDMEPVISKTARQLVVAEESKFGVNALEPAGEAWDEFDTWEDNNSPTNQV